jgi:hypothetical protein
MKTLKFMPLLLALATTSAFAAPLYTCKLPAKFQGNLTIERSGAGYTFTFGNDSSEPVLETIDLRRSDFENNEELMSYVERSGLEIDRFVSATIYVTDENTLGKSGLLVFKGGSSSFGRGTSAHTDAVAMSYIMSPVNAVVRCK